MDSRMIRSRLQRIGLGLVAKPTVVNTALVLAATDDCLREMISLGFTRVCAIKIIKVVGRHELLMPLLDWTNHARVEMESHIIRKTTWKVTRELISNSLIHICEVVLSDGNYTSRNRVNLLFSEKDIVPPLFENSVELKRVIAGAIEIFKTKLGPVER